MLQPRRSLETTAAPGPQERQTKLRHGTPTKNRNALAALLLSIAILFSGSALAQQYGGNLTIGLDTEPSALAPWRSGDANAHRVYTAIYETLVMQYDSLAITPGLAHDWDASDDGLTYTFHLVEGITFHNGEAFNADAVAWNFDWWMNAPAGYLVSVSGVAGTEVIDEYTIAVTLEAPNSRFLITLANHTQAILPPQAVEEQGEDFGFQPVGTGPFMFERWLSDSEIALVRNPDYWRTAENGDSLPYLDTVTYRILPDASTRHTALVIGDIDLDVTISPSNVADIESRSGFTVFNEPGVGYMGLRMLTTAEPFTDVRVRQAVSWAIDREAINQAAYFGLAETGSGMYSPTTPAYDPDFDPYSPRDLEKARELLDEAGYSGGFDMEIIVAVPLFQIVAEVLQAQLAEVGVRVSVVVVERGTFLDGIVSRDWHSFVDSLTGRVDPYDYYGHLECDALYNGHDYCNEVVDQMAMHDGVSNYTDLLDPERIELYEEAVRMVIEDAPLAVILYPPMLYAWNSDIHDLVVNPAGRLQYMETWKE